MKAEQRKEIETNSLVLAVQKLRQRVTGRTAYYVIGTIALIIAGILLYYYFAGERQKTRDAILLELATADTPQKLKEGMEAHRGEVYGSLFKLHLARYYLRNEGIPRLGTDSVDGRKLAANSIEQARAWFLELTGELKEKDEPGLVQEAWIGAAEAEEALVGLPKANTESEFRGDVDKAIEYSEKAAAIFPDTDFSKRYKARAEKIRANKEQFVADQKAIYMPTLPFGPTPGKVDPIGPVLPPPPKEGFPPIPILPPFPDSKGTEPPKADPSKSPDPNAGTAKPPEAKTTNPKAVEPLKSPDPKKAPDPKLAEPAKGPDPKAK